MDGQGYTIEPSPICPDSMFYVTKPACAETGEAGSCYLVGVTAFGKPTLHTSCGCPFYEENKVCKHCFWTLWKLKEEEEALQARIAELEKAYDDMEKWKGF